MDAMTADAGHEIHHLAVDGGLTHSDLAMQLQADLGQVKVVRPLMRETTAFGAALASAHGVGLIDILQFNFSDQNDTFESKMDDAQRTLKRQGWAKAIQRSSWL